MKFTISSRERTAGLFLVGSVLLVVAFLVGAGVKNRWFSPRVSYHTLLTRGDGLRSGSPILLSGVEVGYIGKVSILDDQRVDVELVVHAEHAAHIQKGIHAVPRRLLGVGEKRMHLVPEAGASEVLAAGSEIPAKEPMEILDLVENMDFGQSLHTVEHTLASIDHNLSLLDQNGRVDHLFTILDRLEPLLEHIDSLVTDAGKPLTTLLREPSLLPAVRGVATFTTDPELHPFLKNATSALDAQRMDRILARAEEVFTRLDKITQEDSHLGHLLATGDKLLGDGRADKLIASLDRLTDEKKLGALVDHLATLADGMSKVGPDIPALAKDLDSTLKEAVIVLKAMQQTWMLEKESKKVREDAAVH